MITIQPHQRGDVEDEMTPELIANKAATYFAVGARDRTAETFNRAKDDALRAYRARRGSDFAKEAAAYAAADAAYRVGGV